MADERDDEIRELYEGLTRHLGDRTADLLMKRVRAIEGSDWATSSDLADLASAVMARFEQVDGRLDGVEDRLGAVENRLDGVENRLGAVENRLDGVENRLDAVERQLGEVGTQVGHIRGQLDGLTDSVESVRGGFQGQARRIDEQMAAQREREDLRLATWEERNAARREAEDARFSILSERIDAGFDRIQSDVRGQLLDAVTTQTRTLLFALLGSFAVYAALTFAAFR